YKVGRTALVFDHAALKEAGFKLPESRLIVQALKSLGQEHVTPEVISTIRAWLAPNLRARVLADTETATGWVYAALRRITAAIDTRDAQAIEVAYPAAFSETYLRPNVRLEIGPLASWVPSAPHVIRPYAADVFPELFADPACPVVAIAAERTFWEKATILHQQAYRTGVMPRDTRVIITISTDSRTVLSRMPPCTHGTF